MTGLGSIAWWRALARIVELLTRLHDKVDDMARTEQELSDDLDGIKAGVDSALTQITDLKTQIAALGTQTSAVSQDQLDGLTAKADAILATLNPPAPTT